MKRIFLVILTMGLLTSLAAQEITVRGKVKQSVTSKGMVAKILYKSYPTGGLSGQFKDSIFSFTIFGSSKYIIVATAEGSTQTGILVDPKEAKNNVIVRDIELINTGQPIRLSHLIFDASRAVIKASSFKELDVLVALMKTNANLEIQLEGHTDNIGNASANMKLSQDRVDAIKKYLVGNSIKKNRIKTVAFGGTKPLSTENTETARSLNRRVEMRVLKE